MGSILESFCDSLGEQEQQEVRRGEVLDSGKEGRVSCCCFSQTGFHWVVLSVLELSLSIDQSGLELKRSTCLASPLLRLKVFAIIPGQEGKNL